MTAQAAQSRTIKLWSVFLVSSVTILAFIVLSVGWGLGVEEVRQLSPQFSAMVPSTALAFLLSGGATLWISLRPAGTDIWPARMASLIVTAIAVADLIVIASGTATGIDAFVMPDIVQFSHAGMAPITALCFLLVSISLMMPARRSTSDKLFIICATFGLILAFIDIIGYAFDIHALYKVSFFRAMALHTALAFATLFAAVLLTRPNIGWVAVLLGSGQGSAGARRLLPVVLLAPLLLCLGALGATKAGYLNENFRLSVLAIVMMVLLAATVLNNAAIQNTAQLRLSNTLGELRLALDDRNFLLREVYHRVKNNLQQINALIFIESNEIEHDQYRESFRAMGMRIEALAAVHKLLVASGAPSRLDIRDFLQDICTNIAASVGAVQRSITVNVEADSQGIDIDNAITLGLLVNELVSNALKHAFPADGASGTVTIRYQADEEIGAVLTVADDGRGMDPLAGKSAGSRIIRALVGQLGAQMGIDVASGTAIRIQIPPFNKRGYHA